MVGQTLRWPDGDRIPEPIRSGLLGPGAPFEMAQEEVLGTKMDVFVQRPRNLIGLLQSGAERFGDLPYLTFPDRAYTYRSIVPAVASVAAILRDTYGVGRGDRVAIAGANTADWVVTFWATTVLGGITVAMNGWWTGPEMAYGLELTRPTVLLGDERRLERLSGIVHDVPTVMFPTGFETAAPGAELPDVDPDEDDPFLILFTSGTTGRPKGALISHRSNIHFIQSTLLNGAAGMAMTNPAALGQAGAKQACIISAMPLFHVGGLNCMVVSATVTGMHIVFPPPGRWQEETHLRLSEQYGATAWSLVPTQLWRVLDHPDLERYDLSALQTVGGGSAVWPPELLRALGERMPRVRPNLGMGYGATETNGLGTNLRMQWTYEHPDSIGYPAPGVEVEVREPGSEEALDEGVVGEICMRTPASFLGYWENPEATAKAFDRDRWYRTGDFGHITDGFLYLAGRRRDLIIRGGENIYPVEIENRLLEHPSIAEVAVIGVPHERLGQQVKAFVVVHAGAPLTADEVRAFAGAALASFKVPEHVEFIDALPYNATGKVLKHLLEDRGAASDFVPE
ncbi:MAG TPA: class I adenylate-forming enzyme family protein [Acidimicrobiales bacterium]|nr:class I adenylate-forming enzyme family protein [Acidimicrobiales bacterium]